MTVTPGHADAGVALSPSPVDLELIDRVRHALLIRGAASIDDLVLSTSIARAEIEHRLALAQRVGTVTVDGVWRLSLAGRLNHQADVNEYYRDARRQEAVQMLYDAFLRQNEPFKLCCTEWQLDAFGEPNDHRDFARDDRTIAKLGRIHRSVDRGLTKAGDVDGRLTLYRERFDAAWEKLNAGDHSAMTDPSGNSYHDVWMELHSDLLLCLGRQRSAEDGN